MVEVGPAGSLRFVEPLECPTEQTTTQENTTEITLEPNLATFVVGVIATSIGAIAGAKGAFDRDTPYLVGGIVGLGVGLPFALGPWLGNTRELRGNPAGPTITTAGPLEPCGARPLKATTATVAVHGLELAGTIDDKGAFSVSPFTVTDAYDVAKLPPWDMVVTIDDGAPFTQLIRGEDLAAHALEFLKTLDVATAIAPMRLVPGMVPGLTAAGSANGASLGQLHVYASKLPSTLPEPPKSTLKRPVAGLRAAGASVVKKSWPLCPMISSAVVAPEA